MEIERVAPAQNAQQGRSLGGAIVGGLAGGILGNQVGGGNGRTAATAIGAVGGALVGDRVGGSMDNNQAQYGPVDRQVRRCSVVNRMVERNAGFDVSYSYNGHTYNTVMPNDPGANLRVNVAITPVPGY